MSWRRGAGNDFCSCRKPELRQNHPLQCPHRLQPACGQLPRRYRGPENGRDQGAEGLLRGGPARHIFPAPLHPGGDRLPGLHHQPEARRHHQHRGRHQYRAKPVPDLTASGAEGAHGAGAEYDGRGARQRRHRGREENERGSGDPRGAHQRRKRGGRL